MDTELTYKFLKYIALGIVVYFSLKVLHGDKVNSTDTLLISLIIVVGFAILENLKNMFVQQSSNSVPTKCQTEHFSAGIGGAMPGFDDFFENNNANTSSNDNNSSNNDNSSNDDDSSNDSNSSSGSGNFLNDLASSFGTDNAFSGGNTTQNNNTQNDNTQNDNSSTESDDSSAEEFESDDSDSEESSDVSSSNESEASSESASESEQQEEELVKTIVASSEEVPKQVVVDNGKQKTVYVTYDNGSVYVKDPYTGQQNEVTINDGVINNVTQQNNKPSVSVPNVVNPGQSTMSQEEMKTMMEKMMAGMVSATKGSQGTNTSSQQKPSKPSNVVTAHNTEGIERGSMRSTDGTINNEMVYNDYNRLPLSENTGNMDYEYGYTFLPPEKWYPTPPNPPVCVAEKQCPVCPVYTEGTNLELKHWNESRRVTQPDNINVQFVKEKLNSGR